MHLMSAARSLPILRAQELKFASLPAVDFLDMIHTHGSTSAAGGQIKSQYATELLAGSKRVGIHAFFACGRLIGALSWGAIPLPRIPGTISGRIDVVVTLPDYRGQGIAALLMAHFVADACHRYGPSLRHLSIIAQHPAIATIATGLGYHKAHAGKLPLYQHDIEPDNLHVLERQASQQVIVRMSHLRRQCIRCVRARFITPWCVADSSRK